MHLGLEVEIPYVFLHPDILIELMCTQLLAGFAIILGIPFPIWIYYKGEGLRTRNPLTKASTIPKRMS